MEISVLFSEFNVSISFVVEADLNVVKIPSDVVFLIFVKNPSVVILFIFVKIPSVVILFINVAV